MTSTVFAYILSSSASPDHVSCVVPWRVDDNEIFFGPCKKRLRAELKKKYLGDLDEVDVDKEELFIIGFNGANAEKKRKIVWVGKIKKLMTFKKAFEVMANNEKYNSLFNNAYSPCNLLPVFDGKGSHCGYQIRGNEHKKGGAWLTDFSSKPNKEFDKNQEKYIFSDRELKDRDVCFFLENLHFAKHSNGIDINIDILECMQNAQLQNNDVDAYHVFGKTRNGKAKGLAGGYLKIENSNASELIDRILKISNRNENNS